jgi:hypothetical protein
MILTSADDHKISWLGHASNAVDASRNASTMSTAMDPLAKIEQT